MIEWRWKKEGEVTEVRNQSASAPTLLLSACNGVATEALAGCVPHYLIHKSGPAFGLADFPFPVDSPVSRLATPRARYFSVLCCASLRLLLLLKRR